MSQQPPHKLLGPLFMGVGVFVMLLAVGIIPSDGDAGAPAWVGAVAGAGFLFAANR